MALNIRKALTQTCPWGTPALEIEALRPLCRYTGLWLTLPPTRPVKLVSKACG
jgi:hypothetical protein